MAEKTRVILESPDGTKQEIALDTILFGGVMGDGTGFPVGAYNGNLELANTSVSFVHVLRAFIKICEEQGMSLEQAEHTMDYLAKQAIEKEREKDPLDNVDFDTHMIKVRKDR